MNVRLGLVILLGLVSVAYSQSGVKPGAGGRHHNKPPPEINHPLNPLNGNGTSGKPQGIRIIGGVETARNEFPFIVSLARHHKGTHFCGGAIIAPEWVLTAAHCASEPDFSVTAGEHNLNVNEGTEQESKAVNVIRHPKYDPITYEDDICLVKVSPPFKYDRYVQAFAVPNTHYVPNGNATVAGWGTTDEFYQEVSVVLRKVTVPLVKSIDCAKQYGSYFHPHKMICAGEEEGGKDACQGDSGGPLMCDDYHKGETLCGVVSFGLGCARPELAGVYTKVAAYSDWISFEIKKNSGKGLPPPRPPPERTTPKQHHHHQETIPITAPPYNPPHHPPHNPPQQPQIPNLPKIPDGYVVIIKPDDSRRPSRPISPRPPRNGGSRIDLSISVLALGILSSFFLISR